METLRQIRAFLSGKKTYIGMIAAGILGLFWSSGLIDDKLAEALAIIIATWTGVSFRAAMAKR